MREWRCSRGDARLSGPDGGPSCKFGGDEETTEGEKEQGNGSGSFVTSTWGSAAGRERREASNGVNGCGGFLCTSARSNRAAASLARAGWHAVAKNGSGWGSSELYRAALRADYAQSQRNWDAAADSFPG